MKTQDTVHKYVQRPTIEEREEGGNNKKEKRKK
jgi:hypothetical protein